MCLPKDVLAMRPKDVPERGAWLQQPRVRHALSFSQPDQPDKKTDQPDHAGSSRSDKQRMGAAPSVLLFVGFIYVYIYMYVHMHDVMRGSLMSAFNGFARASLDIGVP